MLGENRKLTCIKLAKATRQSLAAIGKRDRITEKAPSQEQGIGEGARGIGNS